MRSSGSKKYLSTLAVLSMLFFQTLMLPSVQADLISTETCHVRDETDDPESPFSFRSAVIEFNQDSRVSDRACTEKIIFQPGSFNIPLQQSVSIVGLGAFRIEKGQADRVVLDARHLPQGVCALDFRSKGDDEKVLLSGITIKSRRFEDAICGNKYEPDSSTPPLIEVEGEVLVQECVPSQNPCCTARGSFKSTNDWCNISAEERGVCTAQHACVPFLFITVFPIWFPSPAPVNPVQPETPTAPPTMPIAETGPTPTENTTGNDGRTVETPTETVPAIPDTGNEVEPEPEPELVPNPQPVENNSVKINSSVSPTASCSLRI